MSILTISACEPPAVDQLLRLQWQEAALLPETGGKQHPGLAGAITGMHHERLMIAGGANFPDAMPWLGGTKQYHDQVYVYRRLENGTLQLESSQQVLPYPIAYPAVATTAAGIVFAGGETQQGTSSAAWLANFNVATNAFQFDALPPLPLSLANAAASAIDHKIFIAGGESPNGTSREVFMLDLNDTTAGWKPLPPLPQPVSHGVLATIQEAKDTWALYIAGGRCKKPDGISIHYREMYKLSSADTTWQQVASLPYALSAATGTVLHNGQIIFIGGDKGLIFEQVETLIAQIAQAQDTTKKLQWIEDKALLQSTHPGFNAAVWVYNPAVNKWTATDSIPLAPPVTTNAVRWNNDIYLGSGEIKAGVRTPVVFNAKIIAE